MVLLKVVDATTIAPVGIRALRGKNGVAVLLVLVLTAFTLMSTPASAAPNPNDVIVDYRADGAIDGGYSADELWDALTRWSQTGAANYGDFDSAVTDEIDRIALGVKRDDPPRRPPAGEQELNEVVPVPSPVEPAVANPLPAPPQASATSGPPLIFVGLTALAALLLLAGVATALARRINLDKQ